MQVTPHLRLPLHTPVPTPSFPQDVQRAFPQVGSLHVVCHSHDMDEADITASVLSLNDSRGMTELKLTERCTGALQHR